MLAGNHPAFCTGCEFAGDIPGGEPMQLSYSFTRGNVEQRALMDQECRLSKGIVHSSDVEKAPNVNHISRVIAGCNGKRCHLEESGFIPVDVEKRTKRIIVLTHLNNMAGIKHLGGVDLKEIQQD